MTEIFDLILSASLSGSVIILMILLLRLVLSKAPRRYICLLWLLAGLRLLVPIQIESPLSLQPEVPPIVNSQVQTPDPTPDRIPEADPAPMVPADPGDLPGDVDVVVGDDPGGNLVVTPPERPSVETPEVPGTVVTPGDSTVTVTPGTDPVIQVKPAFDWVAVLPWVWVLGAGAMGLYTLISYLRLKHRVREAVLVDRNVYETAAIDSPFLLGYLRPRIYLPVGLAPQDLDHILAHEQTHLRRGDHWSKLLGFVCLSVHWFNPLVWMAYVMLCKDIEMACDESVVRDMSTGQRKAYSTALVNCAADHRSLSACPLAFGEVSVKSRILNVLNYRKPSFWISLVCVVAIVFVSVCFMTDRPPEIDPLDRCLTALNDMLSNKNYVLYDYHDTTDGYNSKYIVIESTKVYVRHGDDWYYRDAYTDWTNEYLHVNGEDYSKDTTVAVPDYDIQFPQWTKTEFTEEWPEVETYFWVVGIDWASQKFTVVEASEHEVTLMVDAPDFDLGYYIVKFRFDEETGALQELVRINPINDMDVIYSITQVVSTEEADADNVIQSYQATATGATIEHGFTESQLIQARDALLGGHYLSLLSTQVTDNTLYTQVCFAGTNSETDLAILQLQMEYGAAINTQAASYLDMKLDPNDSEKLLKACLTSMEKYQNRETYYLFHTILHEDENGQTYETTAESWHNGENWLYVCKDEHLNNGTESWYLFKNGQYFQRTISGLNGVATAQDTGWSRVDSIDSLGFNWFMELNINNYTIKSQHVRSDEEGVHHVTLTLDDLRTNEEDQDTTIAFHFGYVGKCYNFSQETNVILSDGKAERIIWSCNFRNMYGLNDIVAVMEQHYAEAIYDADTTPWLQGLKSENIDTLDWANGPGTQFRKITDQEELAEIIARLNTFAGNIINSDHRTSTLHWETITLYITTKDDTFHSIRIFNDHVSIDGLCFEVSKEWLEAWPLQVEPKEDMLQWSIDSMNAVHSQQKIYLLTWQQAAPNPGRTLRVKVGSNWLIQDVENDIASIWLSYNGQQFSGTQNVQQDGSALVQGSFDKAFSLPWPMDGSLKAQDWEYVESFTEADNTLVVFLRQKSDGTLLRVSFANEQHLTGYILTDPNGIVTDGVLSDPDGITPEEHLRAAYQSATATGVALPDYKGRELTQEELDYFAELFQWNPQDPTTFRYNYVLASTFTTAENCNMKYFFYDGLGYERDDPITDEEIQYLQDNGYDYWKGETHRLPADRVEQLLMDYFGLTPDQAWFTLPYNPNTDCYYIFHTDTLGQITQKFCKGYYDVLTGITTLYYPGYSFSPGHIVTLKDQPGNEAVPYRVLSHLFAAERELPHNSLSAVNQWQDAEHYWIRSIADYRDVNDQDLRQVVTDFLESLAYRYHYVSTFDYGTNVSQTVSTIRNLNEQYRKYSLPRIITEEAEDYGWKQTDGDLIHNDWFFTVDWDTIPLSYMESMEESYYVIHYYRVSASEIVGFRHSQTTGQLDAVIRIQAILENGETVYATTTYTMESQNRNNIKTALQEIYTKAYALVHDPDGYFRELFTRKTDGAYAEAWIAELYDAFFTDPAEFLTQLASSTLSNREQSDLIDHMSAWADGYDLVYLSDLLRELQYDTSLNIQARDLAYQFLEDLETRFG